mgnify:CR=1 FL=1
MSITYTVERVYPADKGFRVALSNGDALSVIAYPLPYEGGPDWETAYIPAGAANSDEWDIRKWYRGEVDNRAQAVIAHLRSRGVV